MIKIYVKPYFIYTATDKIYLVYPEREITLPISMKDEVLNEIKEADLVCEKVGKTEPRSGDF